jgi:hypothetical protein
MGVTLHRGFHEIVGLKKNTRPRPGVGVKPLKLLTL